MKRHNKSYKGKHLIGVGFQFRCLVHYHYDRKMVVCRQTWCWRRSWEFYILIHRQQETAPLGLAWAYETSKSTFTMTTLLWQGHTYSNEATPLNSATSYGLIIHTHFSLLGPFLFKSLQATASDIIQQLMGYAEAETYSQTIGRARRHNKHKAGLQEPGKLKTLWKQGPQDQLNRLIRAHRLKQQSWTLYGSELSPLHICYVM